MNFAIHVAVDTERPGGHATNANSPKRTARVWR